MRSLTPTEAEVLRLLLREDFPGSDALREQVAWCRVAGLWGPGSASLHLSVGAEAPGSEAPDGPVPVDAWAYGAAGEPLGTLLLWVKSGVLTDVEYGWVTDEPPDVLPAPGQVHIGGGRPDGRPRPA